MYIFYFSNKTEYDTLKNTIENIGVEYEVHRDIYYFGEFITDELTMSEVDTIHSSLGK